MATQDDVIDFYQVLEVERSASTEEVEQAYRRILETLGGGGLALYSLIDETDYDAWRERVALAYRTLVDPIRRLAYDQSVHSTTYCTPWVVDQSDSTSQTSKRHAEPAELVEDRGVRQEQGGAETEDVSDQTLSEHSASTRSKSTLRPSYPSTPPQPSMATPDVKSAGRRFVPSPDIVLNDQTEFTGALLRRLRDSAGASVSDIAEVTNISRNYLRAIESQDFEALPAAVYVRGFVAEYARVLCLEPKRVTSSFMELYKRASVGER